ncbi:MAG: hypothetical protein HY855_02845 [Burkholderiales bacterium]|nr:hypothetical protein [Burkholderiales bacterium]
MTRRERPKKEQRRRLCEQQRWRCYYCNGTMRWIVQTAGGALPPDAATIEHLDDRFSPRRGTLSGQKRRVAACYACNQARARYRQQQVNMEKAGRDA